MLSHLIIKMPQLNKYASCCCMLIAIGFQVFLPLRHLMLTENILHYAIITSYYIISNIFIMLPRTIGYHHYY